MIAPAHSCTRSRSALDLTLDLSPSAGTTLTRREQLRNLSLEACQLDQPDALVEVHQEVDVAVRLILTAGDAAEDADVVCATARAAV